MVLKVYFSSLCSLNDLQKSIRSFWWLIFKFCKKKSHDVLKSILYQSLNFRTIFPFLRLKIYTISNWYKIYTFHFLKASHTTPRPERKFWYGPSAYVGTWNHMGVKMPCHLFNFSLNSNFFSHLNHSYWKLYLLI